MTDRPSEWAGPVYVDASALVKLFVPEDESDALNAALSRPADVVLSDLALTEMRRPSVAGGGRGSWTRPKPVACIASRGSSPRCAARWS
jgi:hypothetical protein